jgi:hypothetical protein
MPCDRHAKVMLIPPAIGRWLAGYLARPRHVHSASVPAHSALLQQCLRPGDVLLVEGNSRVSTAVKCLTQSTWSHAAFYVGPRPDLRLGNGNSNSNSEVPCFVEADMVEGVRAVGLSQFVGLHARVCRPASLSTEDAARVIAHVVARLGAWAAEGTSAASRPQRSIFYRLFVP